MNTKRILQLETQLFESLKSARQKYGSKIESADFDFLVSCDPSKTFKYIEQLCNYYLQGAKLINLANEIQKFDNLFKKGLLKELDIQKYKSYSSFQSAIEENEGKMTKLND